jgi:hypothetical protein
VVGDILEKIARGRDQYYALDTKIEKRFDHGLSFIQAFTWSKRFSENTFVGRQGIAEVIQRRLDPNDQTLHYTMSPVWEVPIGRGKQFFGNSSRLVDALIGGYEFAGVYTFLTGMPLQLPTNKAFFEGGNPGTGFKKSRLQQFDTSKFAAFPSKNTPAADLSNPAKYPSWTGVASLPGAGWVPTSSTDPAKNGVYQDFAIWNTYNRTTFGSVRNPRINDVTFGVRKAFQCTEKVRLQVRMDMFNALNHPRFGGVDVTAGDTYFGALSGTNKPTQVNAPRQIQLGGRITF